MSNRSQKKSVVLPAPGLKAHVSVANLSLKFNQSYHDTRCNFSFFNPAWTATARELPVNKQQTSLGLSKFCIQESGWDRGKGIREVVAPTRHGAFPHHPCSAYNPYCLGGAHGATTPGGVTNQDLPSRASTVMNPGAPSARASTRHESPWDEGTVYGRLACPNCQAANDRDPVYCGRAAQAISDFEKKFQRP